MTAAVLLALFLFALSVIAWASWGRFPAWMDRLFDWSERRSGPTLTVSLYGRPMYGSSALYRSPQSRKQRALLEMGRMLEEC